MLSAIACIGLGAVLVAAAVLKLLDGPGARAALATYGVRGDRWQRWTWAEIVVIELVLGVAVAAGSDLAALMAASVMLVFGITQSVVLLRGGRGAPCACFGAHGTIGPATALRTFALGASFAGLLFLPEPALSTDERLGLGLGVALVLCGLLLVGLLALAREVGALRSQVAPAMALDVPYEGPEIGGRCALVAAFPQTMPEQLALAVFKSEGCRMCRTLAPAIQALGRHPLVVLREFDEVADKEAWAVADVPGSPYAVCLDGDGTVLAKGTFNTQAQLESVLATAERRRRELSA